MKRYTKKDNESRYYIESANGKLESNIKGHTYGEAIDRFAELENAAVVPRDENKELPCVAYNKKHERYQVIHKGKDNRIFASKFYYTRKDAEIALAELKKKHTRETQNDT